MLDYLVDKLGAHSLQVGYGFVFLVLCLCGFGLPMPEDVILVTGGVLAWLDSDLTSEAMQGSLGETVRLMVRDPGLLAMIAVGLVGILAGDSIIYLAGRRFGARLADFAPLRRMVTPEKLERVEKLMRRRGNIVVVLARYLPGIRAPTYFTAGHARLPYWEFVAFDGLAALVSAPLWVCLGFYFGSNIEDAARAASRFGHYILAAVLVVVAALLVRWWQGRGGGGGAVGGTEPE
jgi:membrane protein DedA with SNARE-associated domain